MISYNENDNPLLSYILETGKQKISSKYGKKDSFR